MSAALRVGFIGLGSQGGPMAQAIIGGGFPTTVWARRPRTLVPFESSTRVAPSPAVLAAEVELGLCVLTDADVEQVALGPDGLFEGLRPGTIVAIHSTVHPDTCARIASALAATGAEVIDAPVGSGGQAAATHQLLVMVVGDPNTFERARPVLAAFGEPIVHVGPLGTGPNGQADQQPAPDQHPLARPRSGGTWGDVRPRTGCACHQSPAWQQP
jgi:3-hydroxyisobutyrate dehydrogenase